MKCLGGEWDADGAKSDKRCQRHTWCHPRAWQVQHIIIYHRHHHFLIIITIIIIKTLCQKKACGAVWKKNTLRITQGLGNRSCSKLRGLHPKIIICPNIRWNSSTSQLKHKSREREWIIVDMKISSFDDDHHKRHRSRSCQVHRSSCLPSSRRSCIHPPGPWAWMKISASIFFPSFQ